MLLTSFFLKPLTPVISLTPSYSDDFHPAFLARPSPCSCQGSVLHASMCGHSSQLSPWSPFLLKVPCFPRWSHPNSQLLDGHRLLRLCLQARFLHNLGPAYAAAYLEAPLGDHKGVWTQSQSYYPLHPTKHPLPPVFSISAISPI